jgi:hypothetical protein
MSTQGKERLAVDLEFTDDGEIVGRDPTAAETTANHSTMF